METDYIRSPAQLRIRETRKCASKTAESDDSVQQEVFDAPRPPPGVPPSPQAEPEHQPRNVVSIGDPSLTRKANVAEPILGNDAFQESAPITGQSISPTPVNLHVPIVPPSTGAGHHGIVSNANFHERIGRPIDSNIDNSISDVFSSATPSVTIISPKPTGLPVQPFENIQEACLLRFWIEEISPWV
jgi:hypothetical protein